MNKFRIIVAGSRGFNDYEFLEAKLLHTFKNISPRDIEIVCGMADGADSLGKQFADEYLIEVKEFPADWSNMDEPCVIKTRYNGEQYNALAGHKRNTQMAEYGTHLVLFWDGKSSGSANMLKEATNKGLIIKQYII